MTRVLVIEPSGNLWGSERALLDVLANMTAADVAVCCPPGTPLRAELDKLQIRSLPYYVSDLHRKSRGQRLKAALGVLRAALDFRPDVVYLNQSGCYKVVLPVAALLNLPIVGHVRILEDAAYLASQRPSRRRLCGLIAISSAVEAEIRRFDALRAIPVHRIYDAYVPSENALSLHEPERVVNRLACVGRLVPVKGQDLLVRALTVLKRDSRVECLMAGEGEPGFTRDLKQVASNEHVDAEIQWLGFVSDIRPLLRTCSVLACPSHVEPLGRVILEAWESGVVPVVFSGSGGAAEIVSAADGGILYDTQTPESLARALRVALGLGRDQAARLAENGRAWMAKHCNPQASAASVAAILAAAHQKDGAAG